MSVNRQPSKKMAKNRGKHANDDKIFNSKWQPIFKEAVIDLSYLLSRGYGLKSSCQLVGNRYRLNARQQKILMRMSASEQAIIDRSQKSIAKEKLENETVLIDGFNILIILESALSDAYLFKCQDETYRDISSVHGSYKRVLQTEKAIILVGEVLKNLKVQKAIWYFDAPVSNSGRLKTMLYEIAEKHHFNWEIHLDNNPDTVLAKSENIIISSDAWILDECQRWFNLGKLLMEKHLEIENVIYAV